MSTDLFQWARVVASPHFPLKRKHPVFLSTGYFATVNLVQG